MKRGFYFTKLALVAGLFIPVFLLSLGNAANVRSVKVWKCTALLDSQTKSDLDGYERYFASSYKLPREYDSATEGQKSRLAAKWIRELQGNDLPKKTDAAAYLGIVRAKQAVRKLEKVIAAGRGGGRIRWVCTRSLGQIGDESSIPFLINLLDNQNTNTRVYAKVSLAEITGVFLGDDKNKWKNWRKYKSGELSIPVGRTDTESRRPGSGGKLSFRLPDTYGRIVASQDYANVPVLVMSGSCWCGGCQQDAEPLRKFAAEYASRGLETIRTVAGDNELAALDFQKHYRLGFVQLLDTNRTVEKRYNRKGWTFLMLADRQGEIVYKVNNPHEEDWGRIRKILNKMLSGGAAEKTVKRDGVAYMPATVQRTGETDNRLICDRFPSVACGPDGKVYVVFTTNRNGSDDVFIRVFDGSKWSEDIPVAASSADEYDGTILLDKGGQIRVCWTSNRGGGKYDIFIASLSEALKPRSGGRLTRSDDDAMHGRMACDEKGRVWVTYYKWRKMRMYSRDKEVYLRRLENGKWSDELQISPTDVPEYEDHTDPAVSAYGDGAIVTWSWDFHPPNKGYSSQAKTPTIFMRAVTDNMSLGKISCVSGNNIDATPVVAVSGNRQIYCAWDSLSRNQRKTLSVGNGYIGRDNPVKSVLSLSDPVMNVCSPSFAVGPRGQITLLWSETKDGSKWVLKRADMDAGNRWSTPKTVRSTGNPRFCSAAYDRRGQLWIAYSQQTKRGREIVVQGK